MEHSDKKSSSDEDSDIDVSMVMRKRRASQMLLSESSDTEDNSALAGENCVQSASHALTKKKKLLSQNVISSSGSESDGGVKKKGEKVTVDDDACQNKAKTPKKQEESLTEKQRGCSGQQGRSSERIRIKKNREFRLPSREKIWNEMDDDPLTHKEYMKLKPKRLLNKFTRETSYYNFDPAWTSGEESMEEFLDDSEDRLLPLDSASSEASGKYQKQGKKQKISRTKRKHISSASKSPSSSEDDSKAGLITGKMERIRRKRHFSNRIESDADDDGHIDADDSDIPLAKITNKIQGDNGTSACLAYTGAINGDTDTPDGIMCESNHGDTDSGIKALSDSDSQSDVCLSTIKKLRKASANRSCVISDDDDDQSSQSNGINIDYDTKCYTLSDDKTDNALNIDGISKPHDTSCHLSNLNNSIKLNSVLCKQNIESDTIAEDQLPDRQILVCNCESTRNSSESVKVLWSDSDELYTCTSMSPRTKPGLDWKVASNCEHHCDQNKFHSTSSNSSSDDDASSNSMVTSSLSSDDGLEVGPNFTSTRARKIYRQKERTKDNKFAKFLEAREQKRESEHAKQKLTSVNQSFMTTK